MRISDWSSDVCSSDLLDELPYLGLDLVLFHELLDLLVGRAVVNPRPSNEAFEFAEHQREGTGVSARIDEVENARGMFERQIIELSRNAMAEMGRASCRERVCK